MSEDTTATTEEGRVVAPKTSEDMRNMTSIKTTEAATSFANFMNSNLGHIEGWVPITPEQAWTLIYTHRVWQGSPERAAEKEALKLQKSAENEERAKRREEKRLEREALAKEKKAEKERKAAEKAAKEVADGEDLEAADTAETDGEIAPRKRKPRTKKPAADAAATDETAAEPEAVEAGADGF